MNVNARSLINKFPNFLTLISSHSVHVAGVTETWLHDGIYDTEVTPPGYCVIRGDRGRGRGGGVAIFLRSDIKFSVIQGPSEIESVWCKLYFDSMSIVVGVVYRPPGSLIDQTYVLCDFMRMHNFYSSNLICMGDFNLPGLQWSSLSITGHDGSICRELLNFSLSCGLKQVVKQCTRQTSVLDLVFISAPLLENGFNSEVVDGISDHKAVLVSIACSVPKTRIVYSIFHDFNRADDVSITDTLSDSFDTFEQLSFSSDVDSLVSLFEQIVELCIQRFVPTKTKKKKHFCSLVITRNIAFITSCQ